MSNQSIFGGFNLPLIVILLGLLGLLISPIFLLAFVVLVGYYLYRLDKRVANLEPQQPSNEGPPPKKQK
jgi:hypothetical protein